MQKTSPSPENNTKQTGHVVHVVGAYIEPLTRFDTGNLIAVKEVFSLMPIEIETDQTVTFSISTNEGAGKLPSGVTDLTNKSKYDLSLATSLNEAKANGKEAITLWVRQDEGAYRRLLPASAAFKFAPGNVGYERICSKCGGERSVPCSKCNGHGSSPCSRCSRTGQETCPSCYGTTTIDCSSCGGSGTRYDSEPYNVWDSNAKVNRVYYRQVTRPCYGCGGSRKRSCGCLSGRITCRDCGGDGYLQCRPCGSSGRVDCDGCRATGIQHHCATITANVVVANTRTITSDDDILKNLIRDKFRTLSEYPELGTVARVSHSVQTTDSNTKLSSNHNLLIETRRAEIDVDGRLLTFYGFGPKLKVVDFQNVAGFLLEKDLSNLEKSAVEGDLLQATLQFVESEVNLKITECLLTKVAKKDGKAELAQQFKGVVDEVYISRANSALGLALSKLFRHEFWYVSFWILAIGLLAGLFMQLYQWPLESTFAVVTCCAFGTLLVWLSGEHIIQRKISKNFPALVSRRINALLRRSDGVRQMRVIFWSSFSVLLGGGLWGCDYATSHFPWVQETLLHRPFDASSAAKSKLRGSSNEAITAWIESKEPDLQLRRYPESSLLVHELGRGNSSARTILAWKQLLGMGGASKDIDGASAWLAQSHPETSSEDYLLVARALVTMNQVVTPDALIAAARSLDAAANRGMLEARYWEARLYLADNNVLKDTTLGFRKLQQAADGGHAHAAYYLGLRLFEGRGTLKNLIKARKFLTFAQSKGISEARDMLETLKK